MNKKYYLSSLFAYGAFFLLFIPPTKGHEGPDPLGHWIGRSDNVKNGKLISRLGPNGSLSFKPTFIKDIKGESILFEGPEAKCLLATDFKSLSNSLPRKALTVSAWVSVRTSIQWGGILGVIQDNEGQRKGVDFGIQ
jgi:hypothetical protein